MDRVAVLSVNLAIVAYLGYALTTLVKALGGGWDASALR